MPFDVRLRTVGFGRLVRRPLGDVRQRSQLGLFRRQQGKQDPPLGVVRFLADQRAEVLDIEAGDHLVHDADLGSVGLQRARA